MSPLEFTEQVLARWADQPGPLLPVLHDLQDQLGYVPPEAIPAIARTLRLSQAEVTGVISFYHHFRSEPAGRHVLRLCRGESCQAMGSEALAAEVKASLGLDFHDTSADGRLTLLPADCLGLCACSPSGQLDDQPLGRLTAARVRDALAEGTP